MDGCLFIQYKRQKLIAVSQTFVSFVEDASHAVDTFLAILPAEGAKPMATATTARRTIRVAYILVLMLISCEECIFCCNN